MTDNKEQFFILEKKEERVVIFDDNDKEKIIGIDKIQITPNIIDNILLVDNLKHNVLSINQLYDKEFEIVFKLSSCIVTSPFDDSIKFIRYKHGNIYLVDLDEIAMKSGQCLIVKNAKIKETSWLWYRRLGHASMHTLWKLAAKDLVKGLPKLNFEYDLICDAYQFGK